MLALEPPHACARRVGGEDHPRRSQIPVAEHPVHRVARDQPVLHVDHAHRAAPSRPPQGAVVGASAVLGGGRATYDLVRMGAQVGLSLPYGRGQESEADVVGLEYMAAAGFDPRQSVKLWKNMDEQNKSAPPEFFSTHPSSDTRIEDLIAQLPTALVNFNAAKADGKRPQCK